MVVTALLLPPAAQAAEREKIVIIAPMPMERTLVDFGGVAIKIQAATSAVLSAADGAGGAGFAASPPAGAMAVPGTAKARLSLTFDFGDTSTDHAGRLPIPLGPWAHSAQAALSLSTGGKLSLDVGTSFGSAGGATRGSRLSLDTNVLNPAKRTVLRWQFVF